MVPKGINFENHGNKKRMMTCGSEFPAIATIPTIVTKPIVNASKCSVGNRPKTLRRAPELEKMLERSLIKPLHQIYGDRSFRRHEER